MCVVRLVGWCRMMSDDVGCQDLRRRLSIHFLQHLGGFLHPGDRHRSHPPGHRNSGTKNGKRGGAAAARPQICAPCHWPPASDLRLEEILYHVILWCIYIYIVPYIYIMWLYVIYYCMWLCHIVSCCLCFDNFWWWLGVSSLKRLCIKSQTCKGAVAPNISKQSIVSRLTSLSSL